MEDTIAAIATSLGIGSISIIRVSGPKSISIVNKLFKGKNLEKVDTHTIHYGFIMEENRKIDEVLVSIMKSPRSFTMEDIVEINCHGGIASTNKVLELLLIHGARLAEPGEFTKRAFLNGRIDLLEAEGVMDLIEARTEKNRELAISQVGGNVSKMIEQLRKELVAIISNIEVNIDYPEYEDIEVLTEEKIVPQIKNLETKMKNILKESKSAKVIKEGILTSIVGRPNVGKSSLLNLLLEEEKAIVTDIPGTTRDIVEGMINIEGVLLNVIDTAGIRSTENKVESIGVQKSYDSIKKAELVLFVLNYNEEISEEDLNILDHLKHKNYLILINKTDLDKHIDESKLDKDKIIYMSTVTSNGLSELKNRITEMYNLEELETVDPTYLTNARSIALLEQSKSSLHTALEAIQNGLPVDIAEIDIKNAWNLLGEIIGETYTNELIEELFSRFCLGK